MTSGVQRMRLMSEAARASERGIPRQRSARCVVVPEDEWRSVVLPDADDSEAARVRSAALLDALASEDALIEELALTPPYARWPRPPSVVSQHRDGRYEWAE